MGRNIYFYLYKNPIFKDQFYEINNYIRKDYGKFLDSLPKKYLEYDKNGEIEDIIPSEGFDLNFSDVSNGITSYPKISSGYDGFIDYILGFWRRIATKYFFEECVLIDIHEFKNEFSLYFFYKGDIKYLSSLDDDINHTEIIECIDIIIKQYNKPFQYEFKEISVLSPTYSIKLDQTPKMVIFSPNEKYFVCILFNGEIIKWNFHTREILQRFAGHNQRADAISISSDNRYILSSAWDKTLKIWDLLSGRLRTTIQVETYIHFIKTTPNNKFIVTAMDNGKIVIWELSTGKKIRTLEGHVRMAFSVSVTSDEKYIVTSAYDGTIKIWELKTGALIRTITGHERRVISTVSGNGKLVIGAYSDGNIEIWDLETGHLIKEILGHKEMITKVQFMHNDQFFVSSSSDFTLKVWNANDGTCVQILEGHSAEISDFSIALSDNFLVSCAHDNSVIIWKLN